MVAFNNKVCKVNKCSIVISRGNMVGVNHFLLSRRKMEQ